MVTKLDTAIGLLKSARNTLEDLLIEGQEGSRWELQEALDDVKMALEAVGEGR